MAAYTLEALINVRALRLYVFQLEEILQEPYDSFSPTLTVVRVGISHFALNLMTVSANTRPQCGLQIPIPEDYEIEEGSLRATKREDCLELRGNLLQTTKLCATQEQDCGLRDIFYRDVEALASCQGGVVFYCNRCKARLTSKPCSAVRSLPSPHWLELSENMFCGGRCCELSKGGERSLAMARQHYLDLIPRSGAALVGPSTVLVHSHDLVDLAGQKSRADVAPPSGTSSHSATGGSTLSSGHQSEGLRNCEDRSRIADVGLERLALARNDGAAWPIEISREWEGVLCSGCGELVGIEQVEGLRRGLYGAHLFKHRVSTTRDPNSPANLWRGRTLEVSVAAELKALAVMNSCHRIVVRGLHTHKPLALVVLLNVDARMAFGQCLAVATVSAVRQDADRSDRSADGKPATTDSSRDAEDLIPEGAGWERNQGGSESKRLEDDVTTDGISGGELGGEAGGLETVVKLMFYDCSCSQEGQEPFGGAESWAKQQSTEDMYMVHSEAMDLLHLLRSNSNRLPASSRRFQQFLLSFLRF